MPKSYTFNNIDGWAKGYVNKQKDALCRLPVTGSIWVAGLAYSDHNPGGAQTQHLVTVTTTKTTYSNRRQYVDSGQQDPDAQI